VGIEAEDDAMIRMVHRVLKFCDRKNAKRIRASYKYAFLKSFMQNAPVMAAMYIIREMIEGQVSVLHCVILAGVLLLCFALTAVFQNISDRLQSSSGYKVFADKRIKFATHLRKLPMGYFTAGNIGKISSILSEDMVFVEENSMSIIAEVVSGFFSQLVLTIFMFLIHPLLGVVAAVTAGIVMLISVPMNNMLMRNSKDRQESVESLTGAVIEYAEGMAVSKSFGLTGESSDILRNSFAKSREANLRFEQQFSPWERTLEVVYAIGTAMILIVMIWLGQNQLLDTAGFIGVLLLLLNAFTPFRHVFQLGARITIMDIALSRIEEVFAQEPLEDDGNKIPDSNYEHEIVFDNVSFSYEKEEILHNVSFSTDSNQMIALVGESGGGKTTIANLLARFWDVDSGEILLRGVNVKDMSMATLMSHISMVFQKVYLFEDTVFNNIAMGKENATFEEVVEAARKARCYDFIMELPYGFDTIIGEGGTSLSGGEAQRISIARCILKDSPIIILDEATASIDADNEMYIREAMYELCQNKTVLVIAHRLNTIRDADKIIALDHGSIAEQGTHEELMKKGGLYFNMVQLQENMNSGTDGIGYE
jgi:ATP-binding cassette subfamily B protein